jgi:5-oxoprolinase (ATP-hydrolysing) subunit A
MSVVDLNADVGESDEPEPGDAELVRYVTSVNIACGGHAGNAAVMAATVELAMKYEVAIGAHPGFADRANFGRRERPVSSDDVRALITDQVATLADIAARLRSRLHHVKPHGALYNMAAGDARIAEAIAAAVTYADPTLKLVGLSGSALIRAGRQERLDTVSEAFADRAYLADGSLAPRSTPGAVLADPRMIAERAVAMVRGQCVTALDGTVIPVAVETLCIHGDTPDAVQIARQVRAALESAGVVVSARR